jgi:hypothetical protein
MRVVTRGVPVEIITVLTAHQCKTYEKTITVMSLPNGILLSDTTRRVLFSDQMDTHNSYICIYIYIEGERERERSY